MDIRKFTLLPGGKREFTEADLPSIEAVFSSGKAIVPSDDKFIGVVKGYASTPDVDESNEVVELSCWNQECLALFMKYPVLFLLHDWSRIPVGRVTKIELQSRGLWIEAGIIDTADGRDYLTGVEAGVMGAFSIGFGRTTRERGLSEADPTRITKLRLYEISGVSIPANYMATVEEYQRKIIAIKSLQGPGLEDKKGITIMSDITKKDFDDLRDELKKEVTTQVVQVKDEVANLVKTEKQIQDWMESAKRSGPEFTEKLTRFSEDMTAKQEAINAKLVEIEKQTKAQIFTSAQPDGLTDAKSMLHTPRHIVEAINPKQAPAIERFRMLNDGVMLLFLCAKASGEANGVSQGEYMKRLPGYAELQQEFRKVLYTTGSGAGAEFIPTEYSSRLKELVQDQLLIAAQFETWPLSAKTEKVPAEGADIDAIKVSEKTALVSAFPTTEQTPGTRQVTFSSETARAFTQLSHNQMKWSIIDIVAYTQRKLARGLARSKDKSIINGQKTADIDSGVASSDAKKLVDGLRYLCPSGAKVDLSVFNETNLNGLDIAMSKYAEPTQCRYFSSWRTYLKHFKMIESVRTLDKIGPQATIVRGMLAQYEGKAIIPSVFVYDNLNDAGVYDAATITKSILILANVSRFAVGDPNDFELTTTYYPGDRSYQLFAFDSWDFQPWDDLSTEEPMALGYGIL